MTIKTPGKFEGEEDYAPYFYDVAMNGWDERVDDEDGNSLSVFVIDEEAADRYPQLRSRIGQRIAFRESDQGFWEEVAPPDEEEEEPDLSNEAVISDARGGYSLAIEGKHIGTYRERDAAVEAFNAWSEKHNVYYNLFYVNERGAIDQLDPSTGKFLKGLSGAEARTLLDQLLDRVKPGQRELTIDTTGYTRAEVDRIIAAATARGLHAAASPNSVLIRDLRTRTGSAGMRLQWLVPNNAYVFMFGDQLIRLHHEEMFFATRAEALAAAKRRGLKVSKGNLVTTLDGAVPAVEGR
jgi:hypothetical protein